MVMIVGELHPEEYDILAAQNEIRRLRATLAEREKDNLTLAGLLREAGCRRMDLEEKLAERDATIKSYWDDLGLLNTRNHELLDMLTKSDAEIERLRDTALDLASVPEGYRFRSLVLSSHAKDRWEIWLVRDDGTRRFHVYGTGPTPAAALADAIRRIG